MTAVLENIYRWRIVCILCFFPLAALLHHGIFYRPTCMLNPFGADYYGSVIWQWLSRDPSVPWAIIFAMGVYFLGNAYKKLRVLFYPIPFAFLPLTLWIWDIPFTGRWICQNFNDGRFLLLADQTTENTPYI